MNEVLGKESLVRIGCCQVEPQVGVKEENVKKTLRFARVAADNGADLILFPELVNTGYVFNTRSEAYELSEEVPEGYTTQVWIEFAKRQGIYLGAGIAERDGYRLYNSSVLIGPKGYIGKYRKLHLWNKEKIYFEPGDLGLPLFHTPLGRLAMYICYDMWFPEMTRIYALQGADMILNITNWVLLKDETKTSSMNKAICVVQAFTNSIFIAAADRVGIEREQPFLGRSMIVAPSGEILAGPASHDEEEIIYADCNLVEARVRKRVSMLNHKVLDRRIDVYDHLLGYNDVPFSW